MRCPKCGAANAAGSSECGTCAVQFKDMRRSDGRQFAATCAWDDHGHLCQHAGIINTTGSWYCREHWMRLSGLKPEGRGNYYEAPRQSSRAAKWNAWNDARLSKRVKAPKLPISREPGCDDDLSALVPEEVGQA